MVDNPGGADWWQASDGKWYPPEQHPSRRMAEQRPDPPARRWEYRHIYLTGKRGQWDDQADEVLKAFGEKGWEMTHVVPELNGHPYRNLMGFWFTFKRERTG